MLEEIFGSEHAGAPQQAYIIKQRLHPDWVPVCHSARLHLRYVYVYVFPLIPFSCVHVFVSIQSHLPDSKPATLTER